MLICLKRMSKIPYRPIGSERSLRNVFYSLTRREGNYKKDQLAEYVACLTLAERAGYSREVCLAALFFAYNHKECPIRPSRPEGG